MSFRIRKTKFGFVVEVEKITWTIFGLKKKWVTYVKSSGCDTAWVHSKIDYAMMNLLDDIKKEVIIIE